MRRSNVRKFSIKSLLKPALLLSAVLALLTLLILRDFAVFANTNSEFLANSASGKVKPDAELFGKRFIEQLCHYFLMGVQYLSVALMNVALAVFIVGAILCFVALIRLILGSNKKILGEHSYKNVNDVDFGVCDFSVKNTPPLLAIQNLN